MFLCSLWSAFLSKPSWESWPIHSAQTVMNPSTSTIAHYLAVHEQTGACSTPCTYYITITLIGLVVAISRAPTLHLIAADVEARKAASPTCGMEELWPPSHHWGICCTSCSYATFAGPIIRCDKMQAGKQNCNTCEHVCWFLYKYGWTQRFALLPLIPNSRLTCGTMEHLFYTKMRSKLCFEDTPILVSKRQS